MTLSFDLQPGDDELFREESIEQIDTLERALLSLEAGRPEDGAINEAFRAVHTLKGTAATIGHARLAALAHVMEDLLDLVRADSSAPAERIAGELLAGVDVLRLHVDEVAFGRVLAPTSEELRRQFAELLRSVAGGGADVSSGGAKPADVTSLAARHLQQPADEAEGVAVLTCRFAADSEWRAVRMLQVVMEADATGRLVASDPDLATIETGDVPQELTLKLRGADDTSALETRLLAIEEVESVVREAEQAAEEEPDVVDIETARAEAGPIADQGGHGSTRTTIRVDVARLDDLMNLVGELVVQKTQLRGLAGKVRDELADHSLTTESDDAARRFASIAEQIQDAVTRLRMLPVSTVFDGLPRLTRDVATRLGREVSLDIDGGAVELDRAILEGLGGPLTHLIRNAIDHGVEPPDERRAAGKSPTAAIRVTAEQVEDRVQIVVEDDGRGVDADAVRRIAIERGLVTASQAEGLSESDAIDFLFRPGFSTAGSVTDLSGRGVGLDAVRAEIGRLGGTVTMTSVRDAGSRVTLSLPFTLAILGALLARSDGTTYAIPITSITETVRVQRREVRPVMGRPGVVIRGRVLEVIDLPAPGTAGARTRRASRSPMLDLIVVRTHATELAVAVDDLLGKQEIVLKRVDAFVRPIPGFAGATVLPDGRVALVVDPEGLADLTRNTLRLAASA